MKSESNTHSSNLDNKFNKTYNKQSIMQLQRIAYLKQKQGKMKRNIEGKK